MTFFPVLYKDTPTSVITIRHLIATSFIPSFVGTLAIGVCANLVQPTTVKAMVAQVSSSAAAVAGPFPAAATPAIEAAITAVYLAVVCAGGFFVVGDIINATLEGQNNMNLTNARIRAEEDQKMADLTTSYYTTKKDMEAVLAQRRAER